MKPKINFTFLTTAVLITLNSCTHKPAGSNQLQPGSRNYKWTAGTIKVPFLHYIEYWRISV